jgi:hypothetical protein
MPSYPKERQAFRMMEKWALWEGKLKWVRALLFRS